MSTELIFQYVLVVLIVLAALYSIIRIFIKNFAPKKFSSKRKNCDRDCGCS